MHQREITRDKKYYTAAALAEAIGVNASRIRQRIIAGEIESEKVGGIHLIAAKEYARICREKKIGTRLDNANGVVRISRR